MRHLRERFCNPLVNQVGENQRYPEDLSKCAKICVLCIILYTLGIGAIFGLVVVTYNLKTGTFQTNPYFRIWASTVSIIVMIYYPYVIFHKDIFNREDLSIKTPQGLLSAVQALLNYLSLILVYSIHFVRGNVLKDVLNISSEIHAYVYTFMTGSGSTFLWSVFTQFGRKAYIVTFFTVTTGLLYVREMNTTFNTNYMWYSSFLFFCPYFIQTFSANFFFMSILRAQLYFKIINQSLEKAIEEMKNIGSFSKFHQMTESCRTSDLVDSLSFCHLKTCNMVKSFNSLYAPQMLSFVIIAFVNSMAQLFYLYITLRINLKGLNSPNWSLSVYSTLYAYFQYVDLFFHAKTSMDTMQESQRTGRLLHDLPSVNVDGRLKKSVDIFSIQIVQNKLDITICGMFPLDFTLIASSVSSIISFLIIMIQFDLALNLPVPSLEGKP